MKRNRKLLLYGKKTRTIRAIGKNNYRDKCKIGDLMHNWVDSRNRQNAKEFLFYVPVEKKYYLSLEDFPLDEITAKDTNSPIPNETWFILAQEDGFRDYESFIGFFLNHPKKTNHFVCFIWDYNKRILPLSYKKITDFIEVN